MQMCNSENPISMQMQPTNKVDHSTIWPEPPQEQAAKTEAWREPKREGRELGNYGIETRALHMQLKVGTPAT